MLTGFQVATGAYEPYDNVDGELICPSCFDNGETYARPVSNYALDEEQAARAEGWLDWDYLDEFVEHEGTKYGLGQDDVWHQEACACEPSLDCSECGREIHEAYQDQGCTEERPGGEDENADNE